MRFTVEQVQKNNARCVLFDNGQSIGTFNTPKLAWEHVAIIQKLEPVANKIEETIQKPIERVEIIEVKPKSKGKRKK